MYKKENKLKRNISSCLTIVLCMSLYAHISAYIVLSPPSSVESSLIKEQINFTGYIDAIAFTRLHLDKKRFDRLIESKSDKIARRNAEAYQKIYEWFWGRFGGQKEDLNPEIMRKQYLALEQLKKKSGKKFMHSLDDESIYKRIMKKRLFTMQQMRMIYLSDQIETASFNIVFKFWGSTQVLENILTQFLKTLDNPKEIKIPIKITKHIIVGIYEIVFNKRKNEDVNETLSHVLQSICSTLGVERLCDIQDSNGKRWGTIDQSIIAVYNVAMKGEDAASALDSALKSICSTLGVERLCDIQDSNGKRWGTIDQSIIAVYEVAMKGEDGASALDSALQSICSTLGVERLCDIQDSNGKRWGTIDQSIIAAYEVAMKGDKYAILFKKALEDICRKFGKTYLYEFEKIIPHEDDYWKLINSVLKDSGRWTTSPEKIKQKTDHLRALSI